MLAVNSLTKSFGETRAVNGISFEIQRGESFGLLGPNGAGKTTTISMIVGILEPDSGQITLDGVSLAGDRSEAKRRIGFVPQELALYDDLSAPANLRFFAALYGLFGSKAENAADRVLCTVGLQDRVKEPVRNFSGGMKRRLNMAVGLLHDPDLLILDEPTVGVDPQSRNAIFETLLNLKSKGTTLLYTTHYMEEVERLCRYVAIMDRGAVIAQGELSTLVASPEGPRRISLEMAQPLEGIGDISIPGVLSSQSHGTELMLEMEDLDGSLSQVLKWVSDQKLSVRTIRSKRTSLEEVFLELTGRSLRD